MISQRSIELIIATAQVDDVIQDYVSLKRRGVNMIGLCPFHDEKTPSFTVSPSKNIYKCFGCGKGGDSVRFLMDHDAMSYPEALRHLAGRYNIEIEETQVSEEYQAEKQLADSLYLINKFANDTYTHNLQETQEGRAIGRSYFKERGFNDQTIKEFELGYALAKGDDLSKKIVDKSYNIDLARSLGLINKSNYDFFRDRVTFPIHNLSGKIIGFGARTLKTDKKIPKYLNSPESEIYNKRKSLYGIFQAKTSIRKEDACYLVEGYTDVISLHQAGIHNVVASSGTSLTTDQVRLIKRYSQNIFILYDGDLAGIKAAMRGMDIILEQDMNVRIVLLPEGEDPDSFIQNNGESGFSDYVSQHAKDFILFKTELISQEAANDPIKKTALLKDIISTIAKIRDPLKRSVYVQKCSDLLEVDEKVLVQETNRTIKSNIKKKKLQEVSNELRNRRNEEYVPLPTEENQGPAIQAPIGDLTDEPVERDLIRIALTYGDEVYSEEHGYSVIEYITANIDDTLIHFDNKLYVEMLAEMAKVKKDSKKKLLSHFIEHKNEAIRNIAVSLSITPYVYADWGTRGVNLQNQKPPEENFQNETFRAILNLKLKKTSKMILMQQDKIKKMDPSTGEEYLIELKLLQKLIEHRKDLGSQIGKTVL